MEADMSSLSVSCDDDSDKGLTRSQKKYLKKKEKKKAMSAGWAFEIEEEFKPFPTSSTKPIHEKSDLLSSAQDNSLPVESEEIKQEDVLKRIRTLKKKLKQIADLEEKINSGCISTPDQPQLQKIAKKEEYRQELDKLLL